MSHVTFPGYLEYLDNTAKDLGLRSALEYTRRNRELAALAVLCAQAAHAEPAHRMGILQKASEYRDALRLAHETAQRIVASIGAGDAQEA